MCHIKFPIKVAVNITENIKVDFSADTGKVKPMHAVNNGPVYKFTVDQRITNLDAFKETEIPYARTHDAAFCSAYSGEHTVDILAVFPYFDKDATAPESYDFTLMDEYLKVMIYAGVKPFYRLGSKIEHWPKKYETLQSKEFHKWAVICEHIICLYTELLDSYGFKNTDLLSSENRLKPKVYAINCSIVRQRVKTQWRLSFRILMIMTMWMKWMLK